MQDLVAVLAEVIAVLLMEETDLALCSPLGRIEMALGMVHALAAFTAYAARPEAAIDVFADKYGAKHEKAVACLTKDREALLAFFDFPAEHWDHLRTSNPIESVFATVRHRTVRTKGALSAKTATLMVFKLVNAAAKTWRRLKGDRPQGAHTLPSSEPAYVQVSTKASSGTP